MEKFQSLRVWQESKLFAVMIYRATTTFPSDERFGLINQMRRAAVSVSSNIAEGSKKRSVKDRLRFHEMAEGSLEEVKSQILIALDLGYLSNNQSDELLDAARAVGSMLGALNKKLE